MRNSELIHKSIMQDMTEGVMTIGLDGVISYVNPAAAMILGMNAQDLTGKKFIQCFFEYSENDAFNQTILDAVYDSATTHRNVVAYYTGKNFRQLHVTTSYLHDNGIKVGVIAVLSDISELTELRDAVQAMQRIQQLNSQLELRNKLLSETFGRFLSDEIVRQLLDTPDGLLLGGKKRSLTIMMSDLRGFTAMSEQMEPQALIAMLNHYLGAMTDVIQRYNGTIIEFIGDGILAIFGAPVASDHHAEDAVAAAVAMQMRMKDINEWNMERGFPALEMGIGINTGEVIVGNIGSEKRTKYGVVGSHVNLCGRIESYTIGGQILISPRTREMISCDLDVAQELEVYPKGVKGMLTLSHITGIGEPYSLSCGTDSETESMVAVHIPVRFKRISEKHCSESLFEGIITAINEKNAILNTQIPIGVFENISLCADNEVFGKVLSAAEQGLLLHFTAGHTDFCARAMETAEGV
jgi:adenylate cyclase